MKSIIAFIIAFMAVSAQAAYVIPDAELDHAFAGAYRSDAEITTVTLYVSCEVSWDDGYTTTAGLRLLTVDTSDYSDDTSEEWLYEVSIEMASGLTYEQARIKVANRRWIQALDRARGKLKQIAPAVLRSVGSVPR